MKIAKYLRQYGWEPVICTAENAHYPSYDRSNDKDIPLDLEVIKVPIWEPYASFKKLSGKKKDENVNDIFYTQDSKSGFVHNLGIWIRSNFFIPDARAFWVKPVVRRLKTYLKENPVDAIFTDGPPHSNTRIGTLLSRDLEIPWMADFQDPWTQVDYYQLLKLTSHARKRHERMERDAFTQADHISIVSNHWAEELKKIGAQNVTVIPWGYDPDDYPAPTPRSYKRFNFVHVGILGYDRNMETLFEVLKECIEEIDDFKEYLELQLVGQVNKDVLDTVKSMNLTSYCHLPGQVTRDQSLLYVQNGAILLLPLNKQSNAMGRIPGKLFEYLASRRNILSFGPTASDVHKILADTSAGHYFEYDDKKSIKHYIVDMWRQFKKDKLSKPVSSEIEQYSIVYLTEKMAAILDTISVK